MQTTKMKRQRGSASPNNSALVAGLVVIALIVIVFLLVGHKSRHKQRAKLIKTKSHHVYVENDSGSCFEFVDSGGGVDIDLPKPGSSSIRLPSGSWVKASPPKEEEIAEEEEQTVEESEAGEPEADSSGDVGSDSDGGSSGDSGSGDSGGDGGGGDGGGGGGDGGA